jgi:hypothetical protein
MAISGLGSIINLMGKDDNDGDVSSRIEDVTAC